MNDFLVNDSPDEKKYILRVRDMAPEEKPREKLLRYGPQSLTTKELIAVLLNNGTKKEDVLSMSSRIVAEYGERSLASQHEPKKLAEDLDIPIGKALQIVACSELGKRFHAKREGDLVIIRTAKDVFAHVQDMRLLPKEQLRGIYLNTHYRIIHEEVISIGTINTSVIHPREVFRPAIQYGAAAVVLAHNHPSGIVEPSADDIEITKQLVTAGKIIGINLIDHVIIGKDTFKSIHISYE